jgi:hypothetical protein
MSSTKRSNKRASHDHDYYVTPIKQIEDFAKEILIHEPTIFGNSIVDPCAGGDSKNPMSYPTALINTGVPSSNILTIDIRQNSKAQIKANYMNYVFEKKPNLIISNPPFNIVLDFIKKAIDDVEDGGFVVMLLRLNFFGGKARKIFWEKNMPKYTFVHHKRMSFTQDNKTDSIEYAHFVWQKGINPEFSMIKII